MPESDFQAEIFRWVTYHGVKHVERLPDIPKPTKRPGQPRTIDPGELRFQFERPYDMFWVYDGDFHALELKQVSGISFSWKRLQRHQERALLDVEAQRGYGWLAINFRGLVSARAARLLGMHQIDLAYAIRINDALDARIMRGLDPLPLTWLMDHAVQLPRVEVPDTKARNQIAWDLWPLAHYARWRNQ